MFKNGLIYFLEVVGRLFDEFIEFEVVEERVDVCIRVGVCG